MYEDDGICFNPQAKESSGLGLKNTQNRIHLLRGSIVFDSEKDREGTTIMIDLCNYSTGQSR